MIKIGFNTKPLSDINEYRGVGTYTDLLLGALKKTKNSNIKLLEFESSVPVDADLIHYPFFDPFFLTLPLIKNKPVIVTIHDLIPILFPDKFPRGIKGGFKWLIQKLSLSKVKAIITDSYNSANDINEITDFNKDNIFAIPLAPDDIFQPITEEKLLQKVKEKYHLPENYILYVGDVNWNKNINGLIRAFGEYLKNSSHYSSSEVRSSRYSSLQNKQDLNNKIAHNNIKLVLVGKSFLNLTIPEVVEINKTIEQLNITNSILKLGFVPQEELVVIYNLASLYVQPSYYEGFGLPVLEALACGCLVACSSSSSLPEVGGEAVAYFNPNSLEEMVKSLKTVLGYNKEISSKMRQRGLTWAKKISWDKIANDTLEVYKKILNQ